MPDFQLLLIYPTVHRPGMPRITPFWLPPLGLASLAGVTPENWSIRLLDENVEEVDYDFDCDLVGIGCMTANSRRAYEIAALFRNRGKKVVLGGPHVTVCGTEALSHADAIVIGDVESVWSSVLADFENNSLQKTYTVIPDPANMNQFAFPRRDLLKAEAYLSINSLQTTRGCPHICTFCSIASRYNRRYAKKSIPQVIREIETLKDKTKPVFFVDDNIFADRERSKELLSELIKLKIRWWSQADINIMRDPGLLTLAKESGCIKLVVGFESLSEGSVGSIAKKQNRVGEYGKFIEVLHNHGILVNTSFAFGADCDQADVFERTIKFLEDHNVIFATFNILTPLPGTALFSQMEKAGRLIDWDWTHYDMGHPVFQPQNFSPQFLKEGYDWICKEFYGLPQITKRIAGIKNKKEIFDVNLIMNWNLGYKKMLDTFGVFM